MKKLNLKTIKKELQALEASKAQQDIIINNIVQYNNLVLDYEAGVKTNQYLMYQLNLAISHEISNLKKEQDKAKAVLIKKEEKAKKAQPTIDDDDQYFQNVLDSIKATKAGNKSKVNTNSNESR
jgi:hypothetical protein